jgi:hypothetical protein
MARTPISDVPLRITNDGSNEPEVVSFPVDVPLHAEYDTSTGVLIIETPVVHDGEGRSEIMLRLRFTAAATSGFVRVLMALEKEGHSLADELVEINLQ